MKKTQNLNVNGIWMGYEENTTARQHVLPHPTGSPQGFCTPRDKLFKVYMTKIRRVCLPSTKSFFKHYLKKKRNKETEELSKPSLACFQISSHSTFFSRIMFPTLVEIFTLPPMSILCSFSQTDSKCRGSHHIFWIDFLLIPIRSTHKIVKN